MVNVGSEANVVGHVGEELGAVIGRDAADASRSAASSGAESASRDAGESGARNVSSGVSSAEIDALRGTGAGGTRDLSGGAKAVDGGAAGVADSSKSAANGAKDVEGGAKQAVEDAAKSKYPDPATVAKYSAAAAAAGFGIYTWASASDAADASNNTPRIITGVDKYNGSSSKLLISYTPVLAILKTDALVISGSKTTPVIDGSQSVSAVVTAGQIVIDFGTKVITDFTPGGSIKVTTTVATQAAAAVNAAANATTGGFFDSLLDPNGFFQTNKTAIEVVCGIIGGIILLLIFVYLYKTFRPSPKTA